MDRPAGRRQDRLLPRRRRARGGRLHPGSSRRGARRERRPRPWRCCTAPTRSRARWKTACARPTSPTSCSAASASTSARRSRTRSSYLKLVLNPHDDVALRRVINVPARGIGKGVMDALEQVDAGGADVDAAAAARRAAADGRCRNSLWAKLGRRASTQRLLTPRQVASLAAFRDMLLERHGRGRAASRCRSCSARCSISRGYLRDLREERSEEADGRIENLMELVSAAREYETREPGAVARRLRRSPVAALRRRQGAGQPRAPACC